MFYQSESHRNDDSSFAAGIHSLLNVKVLLGLVLATGVENLGEMTLRHAVDSEYGYASE